ncbi:hypothetical protein C1M55_24155 [Rhodococcus qingshengii]|uniref:hypothetical protein n=1 Tax=Rhodococcus qingshengii TaxID=334542 RepID=UPI000C9EF9F4|nr:hypothetical protein [Rhodococcus qingshengii]AUS33886.1 hypothetical protein C1M55_24155 [Rhodococcus qingshengii]
MTDTTRSLLDRIDALVDEQLDGGEPETGYDFDDPDFPECPHCNGDWHGLVITERIERMRLYGTFDVKYKYAEDDSPVLCPGSDFIGPWATPNQIKMMRHRRFLGTTPRTPPWIEYRSTRDAATTEPARAAHNPRDLITHEAPDLLRYLIAARSGRESLLREILRRNIEALYPGGMWSLPDDPLDLEEWSGVPPIRVSWRDPAPVTHESRLNVVGFRGVRPDLEIIDETHIRVSLPGGVVLAEVPEAPSTPQERALPRPSSTPPMWAVDPTRSRRRRNQ